MSATIVEQYGDARIRYSGLRLPTLPDDLEDCAEAALSELAGYWRETFGPRHFRREAFTAYSGYESDFIYCQRKKRGRDADPLVSRFGNKGTYRYRGRRMEFNASHEPGNLRRAFLKGTMVVRSVGRQATRKAVVTWPNLPRYTYVDKHGRARAQGPRKYLELTMTNQQEASALAERFFKLFQKHLEAKGT